MLARDKPAVRISRDPEIRYPRSNPKHTGRDPGSPTAPGPECARSLAGGHRVRSAGGLRVDDSDLLRPASRNTRFYTSRVDSDRPHCNPGGPDIGCPTDHPHAIRYAEQAFGDS